MLNISAEYFQNFAPSPHCNC